MERKNIGKSLDRMGQVLPTLAGKEDKMSADILQALRKVVTEILVCSIKQYIPSKNKSPPLLSVCSTDRNVLTVGFDIRACSTPNVSDFTTALGLSCFHPGFTNKHTSFFLSFLNMPANITIYHYLHFKRSCPGKQSIALIHFHQ